MTSIYIGNWYLFSGEIGDIELPKVDPEFTSGRSVGVWPIPDSISTDIPNPGDYVIFTSGGDIYGIGRIGGISTQESTIDYVLQLVDQDEIYESVGAVATIVQYQETDFQSRGGRPNLEAVFEDVDANDLDEALPTGFPPGRNWILQKVPDQFWSDHTSPSILLGKVQGINTSEFYTDPGGGRGPNRNNPSDEFDDSGSDLIVDRTGTLLEQAYASRSLIQDSSKSSLQIAILLFGIIVASVSVFRQEIESGLVNVQNSLIWGGLLIATGVILAAFVFIHTTGSPRPYAEQVADQQNRLNEKLPEISEEGEKRLTAEFSDIYHDVVNRVRVGNRILGGVVGAAVGLSLGGVFLSTLSILFQVGMEKTITGKAIMGISIVVVILILYGSYFAYDGVEKFERDWRK
ncbi:hypothetical protein [Halostella pelagica]|uniref:hypothetical protein n=1 Tax=Halostella pelagica TaxID=2583824 RepID=UPI0010820EA2|nr:hypothetical protein [Halostella pelagica]